MILFILAEITERTNVVNERTATRSHRRRRSGQPKSNTVSTAFHRCLHRMNIIRTIYSLILSASPKWSLTDVMYASAIYYKVTSRSLFVRPIYSSIPCQLCICDNTVIYFRFVFDLINEVNNSVINSFNSSDYQLFS